MQIILTEEEYNVLKGKDSGAIADYQRKFRSHLSQNLQRGLALRGDGFFSLETLRNIIDEAEKFTEGKPDNGS